MCFSTILWRHCIVSLSKTHLSLLGTGSTQEDPSRHNEKLLTGMRGSRKFCQRGFTFDNAFCFCFVSWWGDRGSKFHHKWRFAGGRGGSDAGPTLSSGLVAGGSKPPVPPPPPPPLWIRPCANIKSPDHTCALLFNNSFRQLIFYFQVITPFRNLVLCAESRKDMEEWITALKTSSKKEYFEVSFSSLTLCLLVSPADNLCKRFGPRPCLTLCRAWSWYKLFDTLMVFLKEIFGKVDFEKKQ